nr:MAG TPA: putative nuclease [Caudoviricetes sp.]
MKSVYPVIITQSGDDYVVTVPDLEINTEGKSLPEAIDMAREAIGLWGISQQDLKLPIPKPKTLKPACAPSDMVALVDIDFNEFRIKEDNRTVRKNCTIPLWLNRKAEEKHINFSAVLQEALKSMV